MAEATASLSPNRALERIRGHRHAVIMHAQQSAKKAALTQLRARGLKVAHFSAREIRMLADVEFERNRARLLAEAEVAIATWPGFARWRCAELSNNAQPATSCSTSEISVQKSGAK